MMKRNIGLDFADKLAEKGITVDQYESFRYFYNEKMSLKYHLELLRQTGLSIDQALYLIDIIRLEKQAEGN